jgi:hypothetical protein
MITRLVSLGNVIIDLVAEVPELPERGADVLASTDAVEVGGGFNLMAAAASAEAGITDQRLVPVEIRPTDALAISGRLRPGAPTSLLPSRSPGAGRQLRQPTRKPTGSALAVDHDRSRRLDHQELICSTSSNGWRGAGLKVSPV